MKYNEYVMEWFIGKMAMRGFENYMSDTSVDRGIEESLFLFECLERIKKIEDKCINDAGSVENIKQELSGITNQR